MRFWWATQNSNYDDAIREGTLWTCPRPNGRKLENSRGFIKQLCAGDIVFHHAHSFLRAVSIVTEEWQDCQRPAAYRPARDGEVNDGWLVRVERIPTERVVHYTRVAELIQYGRKDAPFHSGARPAERFLSSLTEEEGYRLLDELEVELAVPDEGFMGRPDSWWNGQNTDVIALARLRTEQSDLRRYLLAGRAAAKCSVCGTLYPRSLLIAGHIKPRSLCTEDERRDFKASAMLICSVGCDALFEWGYIVVDDTGTVRVGKDPETSAVADAVAARTGKGCLAFSSNTAIAFKEHAKLHG